MAADTNHHIDSLAAKLVAQAIMSVPQAERRALLLKVIESAKYGLVTVRAARAAA